MAQTRKRKNKVGRPKKKGAKAPLQTVNGIIRIKPNVFEKVRGDEDFATLVRVGRLLNAMSYMAEIMHISPESHDEQPLSRRTLNRNVFNAAGYGYEGILLAESLTLKYGSDPFFSKFKEILGDPGFPRKKKILRLMRHTGAFHLDSDNVSTKAALSKLRIKKIDLFSNGDGLIRSFYFHLADTIDINHVIDEIKTRPDEDEGPIHEELLRVTTSMHLALIIAADQFIEGLFKKLNFAQ